MMSGLEALAERRAAVPNRYPHFLIEELLPDIQTQVNIVGLQVGVLISFLRLARRIRGLPPSRHVATSMQFALRNIHAIILASREVVHLRYKLPPLASAAWSNKCSSKPFASPPR